MLKLIQKSALLMLLMLAIWPISAAAYQIGDDVKSLNVGYNLEYFRDDSNALILQDVMQDQQSWRKSGRDFFNAGHRRTAYWFRLSLDSDSAREMLFEIDNPILDQIDFYRPHGAPPTFTGDTRPFKSRDINDVNFIFRLELQPGVNTFYFRIADHGALMFRPILMNMEGYADRLKIKMPMHWFYFGLMFVMIFYNFFLYISTREQSYLFFLLFVANFLCFEINYAGFSYQTLWPDNPWWANQSIVFHETLMVLLLPLFFCSYLNTREVIPRLHRWIVYTAILPSCLAVIYSIFGDYRYASLLVLIFAVYEALLLTVVVCYLNFVLEYRQARFIIYAFAIFLLTFPFAFLLEFDLLPMSIITQWCTETGSGTAVVLMSFALADKVNVMKDNLIASNENLSIFKGFAEASGQGLVMADLDSKIVYLNSAMCRMLDESDPARMIGRDLTGYYSDDFRLALHTGIYHTVKVSGEWTGEMLIKTSTGKFIPAIQNIFLIRDRENRPLYYAGVVTDISKIKLAEEALRESESKYRDLIHNSNSIILRLDPHGNITFFNEYAVRFYGYNQEEIIGRNVIGTIVRKGSEDERQQLDMLGDIQLIPEKYISRETVNMRKSGEDVWISWTNKAVCDEAGNLVEIFCIGTDVTERRHLEEQLRQSQKMESIGTLAGGIAHDFNNILSPIIGFTEMTMDQLPVDSRARSNLEKVLKAADRAKDMVKHILTFSRQNEQEFKPIELQYIVKEALKLMRATLPSTIEIIQQIDNDCGAVKADPTQIHQVMMNLCTNAFHAMTEGGGILSVKLYQTVVSHDDLDRMMDISPGQYVVLEIGDTGSGMDESVLRRIFDPYFTTKSPDKGTGMGLAVVHGIVRSHNGAIAVESDINIGTTFKVHLPLYSDSSYDSSQISETIAERFQPGEGRILLVDDEMHIVDMMQQMLEMLGYTVTAKLKSREALKIFKEAPDLFDLVITDQTMPGLTGNELAAELLSIRPNLPIILCTGYSENFSEEDARDAGIVDYIMKPVDMKTVSLSIHKALKS